MHDCSKCRKYKRDEFCEKCNYEPKDLVDVVRCKDCKHNHCELVAGEECWLCGLGHEGHKIDRQDFYCADGERREA